MAKKPMHNGAGARVPASVHAIYDSPLQIIADRVLIIPDLESPFQHQEFTQKVFDLAAAWKVKDLVLAGDAVHNETLSGWGAKWGDNPPAKNAESILEFIRTLPEDKRAEAVEVLEKAGALNQDTGLSGELADVRSMFRAINSQFDRVYYVMGNHEDRLLRRLEVVLNPADWLRLLETGDKWRIAPYYYAIIRSGGQVFRVVHPRTASDPAPAQIAAREHCHVLMAHSHKWQISRDPSGKYWAAHIGHCVDERRLYYVQRDRGGWQSHGLGAAIIRDGYPYFLSEDSPFDVLMSA